MKWKLMIALMCIAMTATLLACSAGLAEVVTGEGNVIIFGSENTRDDLVQMLTDIASEGETIKLTADFDFSSNVPSDGYYNCRYSITIDLNGHTLNIGAATFLIDTPGLTMTLKDTSENQAGQITGSGGSGSDYVIAIKDGFLTIESGSVCGTKNGISVGESGHLTVSGGSVTAPNGAVYTRKGTVTVNANGSVTATGDTAVYSQGGTVTVNGGSVAAAGQYAVYINDANAQKGSNVMVSGGSLSAAVAPTVYVQGYDTSEHATLTVTGGTITQTGHDEAISIIQAADVIFQDGTISATKSADSNGEGGVGFYLNNGTCQLTVSGGTVNAYCCGVYSTRGATFYLSGSPAFTTMNTENADVELWDGSRITIDGELSYSSPISVRLNGDKNTGGVFTKNYGNYYTENSLHDRFVGKGGALIAWNNEYSELEIPGYTRGIAVAVYSSDESGSEPFAYYYADEGPITSAYIGSTVHLDANPKPGFRLDYWEAPEGITIKNDQFIMPAGEGNITITAYYEPVYPITPDGNTVVGYYDWVDDHYEPVTEAAEGDTLYIWLADKAQPVDGYYFTGEFKVYKGNDPQGELYVDSFEMPAQAVYVQALQEEQEPLTLSFTTNPIRVPLDAFYQITGSYYGTHDIDLNGGGIPDVTLFYQYNDDDTEEFLALLLPDHDVTAGQYEFTSFYDPITCPYSSVTFVIPGEIDCVISFDPGDPAASDTMDDVTVQMGGLYTLPACGFTAPEGMEFSGWWVTHANADGSAELQSPDDDITVTENLTLTALWRVPQAQILGSTLRLGGVLGLNYYVELPEGYETNPYYDGAYMTFSLPNQPDQVVPLSKAEDGTIDSKSCKVFTCNMYAYQMNDDCEANFYYGNDECGDTFITSLRSYLEAVRTGNYSDEAKNLAAAAENYGHYIQPYLASVNGWTVGKKYREMIAASALSEDDITAAKDAAAAHAFELKTLDNMGRVESATYYLTFNADTSLTVKVKLAEAYEGAAITVNSSTARTSVSGSTYTATIPNIGAAALGSRYTVTVAIGNDTLFSIELSPLSYVYTVLSKGTETYASEKLALTSVYRYYQAAVAYANPQ